MYQMIKSSWAQALDFRTFLNDNVRISDNLMAVPVTTRSTKVPTFPAAEVETRLRHEVARLADDLRVIRSDWEPDLDSLPIVGVVVVIQDLFPFPIAPERIVRRGGYRNVDEAVQDMCERLHQEWGKHQ